MAHMEIEVDHSVASPLPKPVVKEKSEIPDKLLKIMKKYKYNWRLDMLSKSVRPRSKFKPEPDEYRSTVSPGALTFECPRRLDHMSRANLRLLRYNKNTYKYMGKDYVKKFDSNYKASWNSMYNYYRRSAMELAQKRKMRRERNRSKTSVKSKKSSSSFKSDKDKQEWMNKMSKPKKIPPPTPLPKRKRKPLSDMIEWIDEVARPKPNYGYLKPRTFPIEIKKSALTYTMSEQMASLASKIPERFKAKPAEPLQLGVVKPSALKYKPTPNIEKLAEHKVYAAGRESDLREDAFVISPNALKYKPTPRILELAKPSERK